MTYRQINATSEGINAYFGKITDEAFTYATLIKEVEFTQIPDQDLGFDEVPQKTLWTAFAEGISFIVMVKNDLPIGVLISNYNTMRTHKIRIKR